MFLTSRELEELTGRRRASAQRRALERMHITFVADPGDGRPRVLRSLVERMLGGPSSPTKREPELRF